jgi:hypothetical protein
VRNPRPAHLRPNYVPTEAIAVTPIPTPAAVLVPASAAKEPELVVSVVAPAPEAAAGVAVPVVAETKDKLVSVKADEAKDVLGKDVLGKEAKSEDRQDAKLEKKAKKRGFFARVGDLFKSKPRKAAAAAAAATATASPSAPAGAGAAPAAAVAAMPLVSAPAAAIKAASETPQVPSAGAAQPPAPVATVAPPAAVAVPVAVPVAAPVTVQAAPAPAALVQKKLTKSVPGVAAPVADRSRPVGLPEPSKDKDLGNTSPPGSPSLLPSSADLLLLPPAKALAVAVPASGSLAKGGPLDAAQYRDLAISAPVLETEAFRKQVCEIVMARHPGTNLVSLEVLAPVVQAIALQVDTVSTMSFGPLLVTILRQVGPLKAVGGSRSAKMLLVMELFKAFVQTAYDTAKLEVPTSMRYFIVTALDSMLAIIIKKNNKLLDSSKLDTLLEHHLNKLKTRAEYIHNLQKLRAASLATDQTNTSTPPL